MSLRLTDAGLLALAIAGFSAWLAWIRPRLQTENNWPLVYYLGLVVYQKMHSEILSPNFVYGGVLCAMLIRFEFMPEKLVTFVRWLELIVLVYIIWRCVEFALF